MTIRGLKFPIKGSRGSGHSGDPLNVGGRLGSFELNQIYTGGIWEKRKREKCVSDVGVPTPLFGMLPISCGLS